MQHNQMFGRTFGFLFGGIALFSIFTMLPIVLWLYGFDLASLGNRPVQIMFEVVILGLLGAALVLAFLVVDIIESVGVNRADGLQRLNKAAEFGRWLMMYANILGLLVTACLLCRLAWRNLDPKPAD